MRSYPDLAEGQRPSSRLRCGSLLPRNGLSGMTNANDAPFERECQPQSGNFLPRGAPLMFGGRFVYRSPGRDSFVHRTRWRRPSAEPDASLIARRGLLKTTDNDRFMQSTEGRIVKNVRFM